MRAAVAVLGQHHAYSESALNAFVRQHFPEIPEGIVPALVAGAVAGAMHAASRHFIAGAGPLVLDQAQRDHAGHTTLELAYWVSGFSPEPIATLTEPVPSLERMRVQSRPRLVQPPLESIQPVGQPVFNIHDRQLPVPYGLAAASYNIMETAAREVRTVSSTPDGAHSSTSVIGSYHESVSLEHLQPPPAGGSAAATSDHLGDDQGIDDGRYHPRRLSETPIVPPTFHPTSKDVLATEKSMPHLLQGIVISLDDDAVSGLPLPLPTERSDIDSHLGRPTVQAGPTLTTSGDRDGADSTGKDVGPSSKNVVPPAASSAGASDQPQSPAVVQAGVVTDETSSRKNAAGSATKDAMLTPKNVASSAVSSAGTFRQPQSLVVVQAGVVRNETSSRKDIARSATKDAKRTPKNVAGTSQKSRQQAVAPEGLPHLNPALCRVNLGQKVHSSMPPLGGDAPPVGPREKPTVVPPPPTPPPEGSLPGDGEQVIQFMADEDVEEDLEGGIHEMQAGTSGPTPSPKEDAKAKAKELKGKRRQSDDQGHERRRRGGGYPHSGQGRYGRQGEPPSSAPKCGPLQRPSVLQPPLHDLPFWKQPRSPRRGRYGAAYRSRSPRRSASGSRVPARSRSPTEEDWEEFQRFRAMRHMAPESVHQVKRTERSRSPHR